MIERADAAVDERGRRRLAEVVADGAEHDGDAAAADRGRRSARAPCRSPSACASRRRLPDATPAPARSRPAAAAPGSSRSIDAEVERQREADRRPRGAAAAASRSRPRSRSAGRSSSGMRRHSAAVSSSSVNSKRAANCTARSTRRLSSPKVAGSTARSTPRSRSARPSNGSSYSPVSGSQAIALMVKSRRRAASSIDIAGSPCDLEALVAAPLLRLAAGQRDVDVASRPGDDLVDRKALADRLRPGRRAPAAPAADPAAMPKTSRSMSLTAARAAGRAPSRRRSARGRRRRGPLRDAAGCSQSIHSGDYRRRDADSDEMRPGREPWPVAEAVRPWPSWRCHV